jgi:hypothetical protein
MKHYLYTLVFDAEPNPVVFYVGRSIDPKRREAEHRYAVKDLTNQEYKYQFCRELEAVGLTWSLVVIDKIEDDNESEYAWVIKFARDNRDKGIEFIDNLPLTNMKRGDFFEEMIANPAIQTRQDIINFRDAKEAAAEPRGFSKTGDWVYYGVTPAPQSEGAKSMEAWLRNGAEDKFHDFAEKRGKDVEAEYLKMINDPARIERIKQETLRLMAEDEKND